MLRLIAATLFLTCLAGLAVAQEQFHKGKVKQVDAAKGVLTVTADGKDFELHTFDDTRFLGLDGQALKDGLGDPQFKAGANVMFKAVTEKDKTFLVGVRLINPLAAVEAIQAGKIKKVDVQKGVLIVAIPKGKDLELTVTEDTRYMGPDGNAIKDGLRDPQFKVDAPVMFKAITKDGKALLLGVRVGGAPQALQDAPRIDTAKLKPLTEMGTEKYQGYQGGLYPGGKNERPNAHEKAGLALAKTVLPRDADGKPNPDGKIGLLSVGMSNTTQVFSAFKRFADADADKNPKLILIDGAQGGMTAFRIQDPNGAGSQFWTVVDKRLEQTGLTRAQVQAVWIKEADAGPTQGFPKYAETLKNELAEIVRIFPKRFPNVKLVYLSSRTYGGYAKTRLNPDPYAFESGFSVKWLIEQQIDGDKSLNFDAAQGPVNAPWLSWGPYLWANGMTKRTDGFFYEPADFAEDGTHPTMQGQQKVAQELLRFFKNDTTTRSWFVK